MKIFNENENIKKDNVKEEYIKENDSHIMGKIIVDRRFLKKYN